MRGLIVGMVENTSKVYVLENKVTQATIECTEKYLMQWLARGFEVIEIKLGEQLAN